MERPDLPKPDQIRQISGGFGWVDHRIKWFWDEMTQEELLLYFFLVSVSNEQGCSWWSTRQITKVLKMGPATLIRAREMLEERSLIGTKKDEFSQRTIYQVLPLPIEKNTPLEIPLKKQLKKNPSKKQSAGLPDASPSPAEGATVEKEPETERALEFLEEIRRNLKLS